MVTRHGSYSYQISNQSNNDSTTIIIITKNNVNVNDFRLLLSSVNL